MDVRKIRKPLRILFVEDHADTAEVFRKGLENRGYEVELAGDFATALQLGARCAFDLLICDIGLPDGNGTDLLPRLREACGNPKFRGIIFSAMGMAADLRRSEAAGYETHLLKPVTFDKIFAAIENGSPAEVTNESKRLVQPLPVRRL